MNIIEFLEARLAEDESDARAASDVDGEHWYAADPFSGNDYDRVEGSGDTTVGYDMHSGTCPHVARHDPARVLREIAIKRDMLEAESPGPGRDGVACNGHPGPFMNHGDYGPGYCGEPDEFSIWYQLASVYSDHPDFKADWSI